MSEAPGGPIWIFGTGAFASERLHSSLAAKLYGVATVYSHIEEDRSTWLPEQLRKVKFVSLAGEETNLQHRFDNYSRKANAVLAGALAPAEVVYFTTGSPVVYDRVVGLIRELATSHGITCHVIPATSCVDPVLAFLGQDMAPGLQICEARWLVKNNVRLDAHLNVLLVQVGAFWTDGIPQPQEFSLDKLLPLQEYLLTQYPPSSPALFVRAPLYFGEPGYARGTFIGELAQPGSRADLAGTSLFLPSPLNADPDSNLPWQRFF
jgi:hypothetical protein